ncbi:MAG: methionine adenosyltransferase [Culicoidibacterales bacterium]
MEKILFTSESVSEGHPDKLCDQISDAILDAYLAKDSHARVACETFATTNTIIVGGEVSSNEVVDIEAIVRKTLIEIGYTDESLGIDGNTCRIENLIHAQSTDIAQGVIESYDSKDIGAGDQGIMFGYATNETEGYMPLPISIAHSLVRRASELRKSGDFKWARPDMKSQVTIDYTDAKSLKVATVLMSIQHDDDFNEDQFKAYVKSAIIDEVLAKYGFKDNQYKLYINPTGRFVTGGPDGDAGLTGRKIIVDTYGGSARHGGGAFSGKDATKVDRSAAYAARYVAKNLVAAGVADRIEIQLSYAIGVSQPISISVETFDTEKINKEKIITIIRELFDLTPRGIIETLQLKQPIYGKTAAYGHFGRPDIFCPWENLDKVELIKQKL